MLSLSCINTHSTVNITTDCYQQKAFLWKECSNKAKAGPLENEFDCANTSEHPKTPTASKKIAANCRTLTLA